MQVLDICCHDHSLPEGTEAEHLQHLQERLTSAFLQCTAAHVASVLLPCLQTVLQQLLTRLQPQTDREAAPAPTSPHAAAAASSQHSLEDHPLPRSQGAESSPSQSPTPGSSQEVGAGHSSSAAKQLRQALIQRLVSTAGPQRSQDIGAQSAEAALACAQQVQQANARQQAAVEWVHEAELDEALRDTGGLLRRPLPVVQVRRLPIKCHVHAVSSAVCRVLGKLCGHVLLLGAAHVSVCHSAGATRFAQACTCVKRCFYKSATQFAANVSVSDGVTVLACPRCFLLVEKGGLLPSYLSPWSARCQTQSQPVTAIDADSAIVLRVSMGGQQ